LTNSETDKYMQVLKFGGSSVANAANIDKVISIVKEALKKDKTVVVASAIGGCTDTLINAGEMAKRGDKGYEEVLDRLERRHSEIIEELLPPDFRRQTHSTITALFGELRAICNGVYLIKEISHSTMDLIMSFGELLSTSIIAEKFSSSGISCKWVDARNLIKTEYKHNQNIVDTKKSYDNIRAVTDSNSCKLYIVPGFIASDSSGRTTTLGRGGSDYTASLIATAVEARVLEIWTDVDGMMTADPRIVPEARTISHISYKEALELSHFGAKVVYPPTIQPVIKKGVPILVKNTFYPHNAGTIIEKNPPEGDEKIRGISGSGRIAILSMEGSGMVGIPGYSSKLFDVLTKNEINIILITQASSVHTMLVAIDESNADKAKSAVDELFAYEISLNKIEPLKVEKGFSIISLVGDDMKNQSGAGGRMFEAIGNRGICIRAIAQGSSEKNVSAVVRTEDFDEAVRAIHNEFFGTPNRQINLFIAGYGNVGRELVAMVDKQRRYLSETMAIDLNIVGICNSSKMAFDTKGLTKDQIYNILAKRNQSTENQKTGDQRDPLKDGKPGSDHSLDEEGGSYSPQLFIEKIVQLSLKRSIFVDCTSDMQISMLYGQILSDKIGIVTCNKIANTLDMQYYKELRSISKRERVPFLYETNAGAALPVISLIRQIVRSGDTVQKIEATLSGSLNYLFNTYNGTQSFASIVKFEKEAGYTEPDPRTDLKGTDLLRKAVILAREYGIDIEAGDVKITPFLPEECLEGDVEHFFSSLEKNEPYFKALYDTAAGKGEKLSCCILIENGEVEIALRSVAAGHPFYPLSGTDNAIIVTTDLYHEGIRIAGAGAGGEQTASGILNDILSII